MFVIGSGNINEFLLLKRSSFVNNKCVIGDGGALWANYTNSFLLTSNFTSNAAMKGSGGAVSFVGLTGLTPIKHIRFKANYAGINGGALSLYGSADFQVWFSFFVDNVAKGNGGGLDSIQMTRISFQNVVILRNWAVNGGGMAFENSNDVVAFVWVFLIENKATIRASAESTDSGGDGGGIYFGGNTQFINVYQSTFSKNLARRDGGAMYFKSGAKYISIGGHMPYFQDCTYKSDYWYNGTYPKTIPWDSASESIEGYHILFDPQTVIDDVALDNGFIGTQTRKISYK